MRPSKTANGAAYVPQSRLSLGLAELPRENFARMREPLWGQAQRLRLVLGIMDQAFREKPVGDVPIDPLPDPITVMQREAEDREGCVINLVGVECHLPPLTLASRRIGWRVTHIPAVASRARVSSAQ